MRKILLITIIGLTFCQSILANDLPVRNQDVSPQQLEKQNKEITKLAAEQLSKNLPQVINKFTTITSIKADGSNLTYTFEINTGAKSDETVINEDRTQWEKLYVENVCKRSKRFLDAQVKLSYQYISAKTKVKLFRFDVTQAECFKRFGHQQ
ncbi:MAG: hypothetical protein U9N59_01290 [Campylobacterota bacterium]|nr:hypothetical protein [Campylobacterota bacterium]